MTTDIARKVIENCFFLLLNLVQSLIIKILLKHFSSVSSMHFTKINNLILVIFMLIKCMIINVWRTGHPFTKVLLNIMFNKDKFSGRLNRHLWASLNIFGIQVTITLLQLRIRDRRIFSNVLWKRTSVADCLVSLAMLALVGWTK